MSDRNNDESPSDDGFSIADDSFDDDSLEDDSLDDESLDDESLDDESEHGFPIAGYRFGEPVPLLRRIPRERWREVMSPLRRATRQAAVCYVDHADVSAALILVGELDLSDGEIRAAARDTPPPAPPRGSPPPPAARARRAGHQVNFRLGPQQHERLVRAAKIYGLRPTTLARVLTVSGVDRALYEERRALEQERRREWPA